MLKRIICWIFGHKWNHPVIRFIRNRKVSYPVIYCVRCGKIKKSL
ncbi:MAG TPA: hypothetical protein ENG63_09785 [Candidatus Desulfofervidus auxilii]|uniref:Uncharacterized protein n=1 Tax=Desulfofervidus auxilii TaxID=1621989 RepID=A0A7C0YAR7_DESA2|nr:hypothetical protein [Candidatus Desulfofervidus auxilii]